MSLSKTFSKLKSAFPTPNYLSLDPAAIDIAPCSIRLMKLKQTKNGFVPDLYKQVRMKNTYDLNREKFSPQDTKEMVEVLKDLKKEFKLHHVIVSLPEEKNYIFNLRLPKEAMTDLASAIRFSLEENVPLPASEVNFDYFLIDTDSEKEVEVVVSVFPKNIVKNYTDILNSAGLQIMSFQSESVSMARSVVLDGDARPFLIVRMMNGRVNTAIVNNGVVQYTSTVPVDPQSVVSDFSGAAARELKEYLNKMILYWFTNHPPTTSSNKIEDVIVVGKYAGSEGVVDFLTNALKVNVSIGNVWSNCFSLDDYIPELPKNDALNYAVAIGLALRSHKD